VTPSRPAGFFGGANEANQPNPYSWTHATDVVFVEQPVGTGFSYGGIAPHNEQDVATDLYNFLQHFYDTFPNARRQRLILAGESYVLYRFLFCRASFVPRLGDECVNDPPPVPSRSTFMIALIMASVFAVLFVFSYAGMYIGGLAHYIHEQNQMLQRDDEPRADTDNDPEGNDENDLINLAGLALGNAWIDATVQGPAVIDYAWWHGWIDATTRTALHAAWHQCYNVHDNDDNVDNGIPQPQGSMRGGHFPTNADGTALLHPFTVPDECGIMSVITAAAGAHQLAGASPNIYDVTTWDKYDLIIAHNSTIEGFFNRPEVRNALNVPKHDADRVWSGCIPGAGRRRKRRLTEEEEQPTTSRRDLLLLDEDRPISMKSYLATLLDEAQLPVLVYNGDRDLSTCAQGSELVLNDVPWRGNGDWQDPRRYTRGVWLVDDYPAGYAKTLHNLNFVIVYNSGHLVPMNQPKVALDMLERFLQNQSFIDRPLPTYSAADFDGTKKHEHHQQHESANNKDDDPSHWKSGHEGISTTVSSLLQQQPWWTIAFVSFVVGILVTVVATRLCNNDNNKNRRQYTPIGEC
jgi:hypothetical protein